MDNTNLSQKDKWDLALDKEIEKLKQCQKEKGYSSCSSCHVILECELRKGYILAVYESMNKGSGGGFEF
jgi:hypothetical protein